MALIVGGGAGEGRGRQPLARRQGQRALVALQLVEDAGILLRDR